MSSRIDSLKTVSNAKPIQLESNPINNSNIAIFSNKTLKPSIDEVSFSNRNIDVNTEEKADTKKKWLIGAGIAVGTIAVGVASYFLLKKVSGKNIGEIIFDKTGYMTKNELSRRATLVGEQANIKMQEAGRNLSSTEITEILENVIGKKAAAKIEVSGDKASLIEAYVKNLGVPREFAEQQANYCLSAVVPKGNGSKTHLNLQVTDKPMWQSANMIAHETEHALHRTFSFEVLPSKLMEKTSIGRKYMQKIMEKSVMVNNKNSKLQSSLLRTTGWYDAAGGIASEATRADALLEITKCPDKQLLREKIKKILYEKKVLEIGNDKQNNFVLNTLIPVLADESRAYNAGGVVEKFYKQAVENVSQIGTTKSEVLADVYDEAIQVMKKERKHIQRNMLKEFFGLKANRQAEQGIVDSFKANLSIKSRPATTDEILSMFKEKCISAEECEMILKNQGIYTEEIGKVIKGISLEA